MLKQRCIFGSLQYGTRTANILMSRQRLRSSTTAVAAVKLSTVGRRHVAPFLSLVGLRVYETIYLRTLLHRRIKINVSSLSVSAYINF